MENLLTLQAKVELTDRCLKKRRKRGGFIVPHLGEFLSLFALTFNTTLVWPPDCTACIQAPQVRTFQIRMQVYKVLVDLLRLGWSFSRGLNDSASPCKLTFSDLLLRVAEA